MGGGSQEGKAGATAARVATSIIVCILILLLTAPPVFADPADPDTLSIESVRVTRNLAESGDIFVCLHYAIAWTDPADYPDDAANKVFLIRFMETDESTALATTTPYPYFNSGYDQNVAAFYFSADDVTDLGITWADQYVVRLEGNPSYYANPPVQKRILTDVDYSDFTDQEDNQDWLAAYILGVTQEIEINWNAVGDLLAGDNLTEIGEYYFEGAIDGLRTLCPSIFIVETYVPSYDDRTWSQNQSTEYQSTQWDGTFVGDALDGLGDLFGDTWLITNFLCIGGVLLMMIISFGMFQTARPGLLLGYLILVIGARLGFFGLAIMALITCGVLLYLTNQFFWKKA